MPKFVDRIVGRGPDGGDPDEGDTAPDDMAREPGAGDSSAQRHPGVLRVADYTLQKNQLDNWEKHDGPVPGDDSSVAGDDSSVAGDNRPVVGENGPVAGDNEVWQEISMDYGKLGEHITSVLEAAKEAAAKMRADAQDDARRVAERTKAEAAARLEAARRDAEKIAFEAARERSEAERDTQKIRKSTATFAAEKRREAESEASAVLARAKRDALEQTRAAQERRGVLARDMALSETRLRQLVGGLRELAGRLEDLVEGESKQSPAEAGSGTAANESLMESLRPRATNQGPQQEMTRSPADQTAIDS